MACAPPLFGIGICVFVTVMCTSDGVGAGALDGALEPEVLVGGLLGPAVGELGAAVGAARGRRVLVAAAARRHGERARHHRERDLAC